MNRLLPYLLLVFIPVIPVVQQRLDAELEDASEHGSVLYLRTGAQVRRLCPGFEGFMAGVYWLRAVQHYGSQRAFSPNKLYGNLQPLIEITTALDPKMELAYRYGAIFLSERAPWGPGQPREAVKVLERGIRNLPGAWRLRWDLGNLYFFYLSDPRRAADVLLEAVKLPGAPFWLENLAASMLGKGGEREVAREVWRRQFEHAEEAVIRENALHHIQLLDSLDMVDALNASSLRFAEREGRPARSVSELASSGLISGTPRDPSGVPFEYEAEVGRFSIGRGSRFWRSRYDK